MQVSRFKEQSHGLNPYVPGTLSMNEVLCCKRREKPRNVIGAFWLNLQHSLLIPIRTFLMHLHTKDKDMNEVHCSGIMKCQETH